MLFGGDGGGVVRGFNKPGTESEDSFAEASHEDPMSSCECSFTGNFLFSCNYSSFCYFFLI